MENNYWIVDEWLIFKPTFNEELTYYYDIINKYKKIMFSNYDNTLIAIETNNQYKYEYHNKYYDNYIKSKFNQKINLLNNINLTHLTFGYVFNQNICRNYTHNSFNKKIDLSKNISLTCLMKYIIY